MPSNTWNRVQHGSSSTSTIQSPLIILTYFLFPLIFNCGQKFFIREMENWNDERSSTFKGLVKKPLTGLTQARGFVLFFVSFLPTSNLPPLTFDCYVRSALPLKEKSHDLHTIINFHIEFLHDTHFTCRAYIVFISSHCLSHELFFFSYDQILFTWCHVWCFRMKCTFTCFSRDHIRSHPVRVALKTKVAVWLS